MQENLYTYTFLRIAISPKTTDYNEVFNTLYKAHVSQI